MKVKDLIKKLLEFDMNSDIVITPEPYITSYLDDCEIQECYGNDNKKIIIIKGICKT